MNSDEFDHLLRQAGSTATVEQDTLDRLVEHSRDVRARRSRKPVVIGLAVAGAVLLAAAATSEQWTKVPPFASLPDDTYRTQAAIPVDFTMTDGQRVHCQSFLEYRYLTSEQAEQATSYVRAHDWAGFGQQLYDDGAPAGETYEDAQTRIYDALDPRLKSIALTAVPTAVPHSYGAEERHEALVNGSATVCRRVDR